MTRQVVKFICPDCHGMLQQNPSEACPASLGVLCCEKCALSVPVLNGFAMFPEAVKGTLSWQQLQALAGQLIKPKQGYAEFIYQQSRRPIFDPYAAYYPFNEAIQGFLRFTGLIGAGLKPGDRILDLSCRSGWTAAMLAALFPEQQVISLWDGNRGMLGYSGYNYWLDESARAQNLEFVFVEGRENLPFADHSFGLVFGYDFLHHHLEDKTIEELFRLAREDAPLLFPHVHTNHSEPDPWFERGGTLLSGADIIERLNRPAETCRRKLCVISELEVFDKAPLLIANRDSIQHYNCLVMVVPEDWFGHKIDDEGFQPLSGDEYIFIHPLIDINLNSGALKLDPEGLGSGVRHLLDRHPDIEDEIRSHLTPPLDLVERLFLYWAGKGLKCSEIQQRLDIPGKDFSDLVAGLASRRLVLHFAVSESVWLLQHYLAHRFILEPVSRHVFPAVWEDIQRHYADYPVMLNHDGSEFDLEYTRLFVNATRQLYRHRNLDMGDTVLIIADNHLEVFIACWAAWLEGIVVVLLNPESLPALIQSTLAQCAIRLAFGDRSIACQGDTELILFDDLESDRETENTFSAAIEPFFDLETDSRRGISESTPALILGTSGSTGKPKLVKLSHGSLFRSASSLARAYAWQRGERLLCMGPSYSMSGIRNSALAGLIAGATIVVPSSLQQRVFGSALKLMYEYRVNIVSTVPAFVENFYALMQKDQLVELPALRQILSTASRLDGDARRALSRALGIEIVDYYGLTETGGICILQAPGQTYQPQSMGVCDNCIVEIRHADGSRCKQGEEGELHIFSDNLMLGYVGDADGGVRLIDGWLASGDQARILEDGQVILLGRLDGAEKNRQGEFASSSVKT